MLVNISPAMASALKSTRRAATLAMSALDRIASGYSNWYKSESFSSVRMNAIWAWHTVEQIGQPTPQHPPTVLQDPHVANERMCHEWTRIEAVWTVFR